MTRTSGEALERLLREDALAAGADWFLVASGWWRRALGGGSDSEGPALTDDEQETEAETEAEDAGAPRVSNAPLLELALSSKARGAAVLRPMLAEGKDFRLVSQRVWNLLSHEYGFDWEIARPVVARGPARQLVVDVYPVAFQLLVWTNGLEQPVEADDGDEARTPVVVLASENTGLQELQQRIWDAMKPRAAHYFPGITESNVHEAVRVCFRLSEDAPWTPLDKPGIEAASGSIVRVGDLKLEARDYLEGKAKFHHLLIETRHSDGAPEWKLGRFYTWALDNAWRCELQAGDLVDAKDTDNKWYESHIIDTDKKRVKVHYRGWTSKWDEWLERFSPRIEKSHTMLPDWRAFRVGDEVQVGYTVPNKTYPYWNNGRVVAVKTTGGGEDTGGSGFRIYVDVDGDKKWMDAQDEMLCAPGTHKASNASTAIITPTPSALSSSLQNRYSRDYRYEPGRGKPEFTGVVGLQNLGNTCFLNSMLQCLINSPPLKDYFLAIDPETKKLKFANDINVDNPLGMKGCIAIEFASLMKKIWGDEFSIIAPTSLKSVIGQYAPQFAGYQQQDSQEVMNFLLDGLHEDLNRVKQKPYTTPVEANGRKDEEVAREEWDQYLRRNDSVIVDNFMGQLRSHVTCSNPECGNESVTFDPFMSLSVPIPSEDFIDVQVQLFWANGNIPTRYSVRVDKDGGCLRDVKAKLSELSEVPTERLFFVDVWNHRIVKAYGDGMSLERVREGVLHAYELELPVTEYDFGSSLVRPPSSMRFTMNGFSESAKPMKLVGLLHQAPASSPVDRRATDPAEDGNDIYGASPKQRRVEIELFNTPLLVSIERESTKANVHRKVWRIVHRLVATKDDEMSAADEEQQTPYKLHVTAPTGATTYVSNVPSDEDSAAEFLEELDKPISFTLEWSRYGYQQGYDEDSAKRIELHDSMKNLSIKSAAEPPKEVTLSDCLAKFTEREQLEPTDTWYCPKCKQHVRAFKKFDLFSMPNVLIVHLKRFRYAQSSFYLHRDKITKLVQFPIEEFDLTDYVVGPKDDGKSLVYDLFAVSEHSGGLGGGHYTAVAKNPENNRWFSFNDSFTNETTADRAVTPRAYVLFYVRKEA